MVQQDTKSKHEQILEITNQNVITSKELGIIHLSDENDLLDGRHLRLNGRETINFGTCGYMGLEMDDRLKQGVIEAVQKYGTAFASTRVYVNIKLYSEMEELLRKMFNQPVMLLANVTLSHVSNIPIMVKDDDVVILDTMVHDSVQTAVQLLKARNVKIEIIRHNRMDHLEEKINELKGKYKKIWYMADGVYSMYGDCAPMADIYNLLDKYEQFNLYIDDTHGMSWAGKNGTGYVMSSVPYFHSKMILVTSLNKAFGAAGGITVFPDEKTHEFARNCSKPFIFSGPIQPPMLGACIASAKIHLSPEITSMQNQLQERVSYVNDLCKKYELPLMWENRTPIFFIGVSKPMVAFSMVKRLMNRGFLFNLSVFPSVAINNAGLRLPISRNHTFDDLKGLITNIAEELPDALNEAEITTQEVYKAFKKPNPFVAKTV
ncbi:MAG: aminotransferase class I/II-fold pyridoxal phosphate-dependent enzyme [Bacteroidota bacterium]|nr:aminotransferase class I/II-fold pyridoxal phosphate-dependent enzyme [Bacteroidota bacterium]